MAAKGDSKDKGGGGGGIMPLLIAAVISVAVGLGAGYGTITMFAPPAPDAAAKPAEKPAEHAKAATKEAPAEKGTVEDHGAESGAAAAEEEEAPEPVDPNDVAFIALPPVITNVAEPKTVWLRLEGGVTYLKSGETKGEVLAAQVAQQIIQYLRTVHLTEIEGEDGLQFLREDLNDITRSLSNGQVQNVLISGLIVE